MIEHLLCVSQQAAFEEVRPGECIHVCRELLSDQEGRRAIMGLEDEGRLPGRSDA